jgi:hypothetical protein
VRIPTFIAGPEPALDQLIDHAVHITGLAGAWHVGRHGCGHAASNGSASAVTYPSRCKRGVFSADEAAGVMGMNFLHVLHDLGLLTTAGLAEQQVACTGQPEEVWSRRRASS